MARARWTKEDLPQLAGLAAIFTAVGAAYGFLRGDGVDIGAIAGLLLFALVIGIGLLVEFLRRDHW